MLIKLRKMMTNQKGFTLIELMVVIAIIGILAAIAIPKMSSATDSAKIAKIQADLRTLGGAISTYNAQKGSDPTAAGDLVTAGQITALPTPPSGAGTAYTYTAAVVDATTPANSHPARFTATFGGKTYYSDGTVPQ